MGMVKSVKEWEGWEESVGALRDELSVSVIGIGTDK